MAKLNLQVRIPVEIDVALSELAPESKSSFVRQAIEEKIARERARRLEEAWISALEKTPDDPKDARRWLAAEAWGPR